MYVGGCECVSVWGVWVSEWVSEWCVGGWGGVILPLWVYVIMYVCVCMCVSVCLWLCVSVTVWWLWV
jgi:hypothetical protein